MIDQTVLILLWPLYMILFGVYLIRYSYYIEYLERHK